MQSKKFCLVLTLTFVLQSASAAPLFPIANMKECDRNSKFEILQLQDLNGKTYQVQWSDEAGTGCPGETFPRVVLKLAGVSEYIHVVTANVEVPSDLKTDRSWNPLRVNFPWTFLDVGESQRKAKDPFYAVGNLFHDNPKWQGKALLWVGSVYGLQKATDGGRSPLLGFSWGFAIDNDKVRPLRPQSLEPRDWLKDLGVISSVLESWDNKKVVLKDVSAN